MAESKGTEVSGATGAAKLDAVLDVDGSTRGVSGDIFGDAETLPATSNGEDFSGISTTSAVDGASVSSPACVGRQSSESSPFGEMVASASAAVLDEGLARPPGFTPNACSPSR